LALLTTSRVGVRAHPALDYGSYFMSLPSVSWA
jgi:hypothetical protein